MNIRSLAVGPIARCAWCVIAAVFLGVYFGGAAPRVEYRERERIIYQDREVVKTVEVKVREESTNTRRRVERVRVERPDGTKIEREIEREELQADVREQAQHVEVREVERVVYQDRQVTKVIEHARPMWRAGVLAGLDVRRVSLIPPSPGPVILGATVERRIVGPIHAGVWGLSSGAFGVSASVEF